MPFFWHLILRIAATAGDFLDPTSGSAAIGVRRRQTKGIKPGMGILFRAEIHEDGAVFPPNSPTMSRKSLYILTAASIIGISACSKEQPENAAPEAEAPPASTPAAPAELPASIGTSFAALTDVDTASLQKVKTCFLDTINRQGATATAPVNSPATFSGWIIDENGHGPSSLAVVLSGTKVYAVKGSPSVPRPDVAKALGKADVGNAGFNVSVRLDGIDPGTYTVSLLQPGRRGPVACDTQGSLTVQ